MDDHPNLRVKDVLRHWKPTRVLEAERAVESLNGHPGWLVVCELLNEIRQVELGKLLQPRVLEQVEYARAAALVEGLSTATGVVAAVLVEAQRVAAELLAKAEQAQEVNA